MHQNADLTCSLACTAHADGARGAAAVVRVDLYEPPRAQEGEARAGRGGPIETNAVGSERTPGTREVPGIGAPIDQRARVLTIERSIGIGQVVEGDRLGACRRRWR